MYNFIKQFNRLNINILGISEARWTNSGRYPIDMGIMHCFQNHRYDVAIIVNKESNIAMENCFSVSERVMIIRLKPSNASLNMIWVYAPTADAT